MSGLVLKWRLLSRVLALRAIGCSKVLGSDVVVGDGGARVRAVTIRILKMGLVVAVAVVVVVTVLFVIVVLRLAVGGCVCDWGGS